MFLVPYPYPVARYVYTYTLGGDQPAPPTLAQRIKSALVFGVLAVFGAAILALIVAFAIVLLPIAIVAALIGWFFIRRRIRQAIRAMEGDPTDTPGRENVRVRNRPIDDPF